MLTFVADSDLAYEGFLINYETTDASAGKKIALYAWFHLLSYKIVPWEYVMPKFVLYKERCFYNKA